MKIREANKFDIPYFIHMVRKIHEKEEIGKFNVEFNDDYLNSLFVTAINGGGIALIAENEKPIGIMMGLILPNIWSNQTLMMNELLWYVDEEHRHSRAGYLMLKKYQEVCEELIKNKRIKFHTINTAKSMFDIDFTRFGYERTSETWINVEE
jgi:hypothetical protein